MDDIDLNANKRFQKIITYIMFPIAIGMGFILLDPSFIPNSAVMLYATCLSLILTLYFLYLLKVAYNKRMFRPKKSRHKHPAYNVFLFGIVIPLFIFWSFWLNTAIALPHIFTSLIGKEVTKQDVLHKRWSSSKWLCNYHLKPSSVNFALFRYCISKEFYAQLPKKENDGELIVKKSPFGYIVKKIQIID